jgi:hypothetical protein
MKLLKKLVLSLFVLFLFSVTVLFDDEKLDYYDT